MIDALSSIDKAQQGFAKRAQGLEMPIHREAFLKLSADIDCDLMPRSIGRLTVTMGALGQARIRRQARCKPGFKPSGRPRTEFEPAS